MDISWRAALANTRLNSDDCRYPNEQDRRFGAGFLFPKIKPRFLLTGSEIVFTIGSCFARNMEEKLHGFDLPTRRFAVPHAEWGYRPNGLLNEFNPGTMSQRIMNAYGLTELPEATIVPGAGGWIDLFLPGGAGVSRERALERRQEISAIYEALPRSQVAIITLGLVEAWYDNQNGMYLNRMPSLDVMKADEARFTFRVMDVAESFALLDTAIATVVAGGTKVLVTVSPVPLQTTFSGNDAVVANSYSKSVLRICAQQLYDKYPEVDYFPSYEIAMSRGLASFDPDHVHILDSAVAKITDLMTKAYLTRKVPSAA